MKKLMIILLLGVVVPLLMYSRVEAQSNVTEVHIHYYRYAEDYTNWQVWLWQEDPESVEGSPYPFVSDTSSAQYNFGGVVSIIPIAEIIPDATKIGVIIRRGNWEEKDIESNRYIDIPEMVPGGIMHLYFVEGEQKIGTFLGDPNGPDKSPKFKNAYFSDLNIISFTTTEDISEEDVVVYADEIALTPSSIVMNGTRGTITLAEAVDFGKSYVIEAVFSDSSTNQFSVTYDGIYDSEAFSNSFTYEGDDLGAIPSTTKTTFRLWAPVSDQVVLNLYDTGTPLSLGGTNTPYKTVNMSPDIKGTFYAEEVGNLHGVYYTYSVTNGNWTHEVIDPYAKSSGINGIRGLVVDFSVVNPVGFTYNHRADNMEHATDAIIYELHVRDLTSHSSWTGSEVNRARYLGLVESGTSFQGKPTGFDHIVDLGVTHVQLLPFFDFGVVDESKVDNEDYQPFNWGYMPLNFNVLEGSYSANPYDGLVRVQEMKQVISAFTDANIRINMDVVYNHTGETADSNFNLIVPGYYHRKTESGAFSNGSGTGNETASERAMMRKFMIDSLVYWATEYNISGFRFDLMALHDVETMNEIRDALYEIDPTIMVYGEPWMGGQSPLPETIQARKANIDQMPGVGAFNDDVRDAIKGSVFNREEGGFVQGRFAEQVMSRVRYGIVGGVMHPSVNANDLSGRKVWHTSPQKTINYVACHDNNTLHDKIYLTLENGDDLDLLPAMVKQANAIVLTSQGIPFIHAGDEFLRSKPLVGKAGFDHNSYESPDEVNQMRWDLRVEATEDDVYEYHKGLIALRLKYPSLRMADAQTITNRLTFVFEKSKGVIAYTLTGDESQEDEPNMIVIHNANRKDVRLRLPRGGGWVLLVNEDTAGVEALGTIDGGRRLTVVANATYVLYQDPLLPDYNPTGLILIISGASLVTLTGAGMLTIFLIKRKKLG
ncbi:MAG: type I pullulanase [Candidatus Izemoplasmatales bacterium]|jgi:pullulanase|nr:type I pullulanase [Candidatus Izemoplasmatales bacterium]